MLYIGVYIKYIYFHSFGSNLEKRTLLDFSVSKSATSGCSFSITVCFTLD